MTKPKQVQLSPTAESVPAARSFAAQKMPGWLQPEARDRALLLVSEIVTNAVRHAGTAITLRLLNRRPTVRVEVDDDTAEVPVPREVDADAEGGRGMFLVDTLADEWGVTQHPNDGKTVWFDITTPAKDMTPPTDMTTAKDTTPVESADELS